MSGINGIYNLDGRSVERQSVQRMTQLLTHRGADGAGIWVGGELGMGHCALRAPSEGRYGAAPLFDDRRHLVLTADARLDNREELLAQLGWDNCRPAEIADNLLILGAYSRWGERCAEYLLGDFAFALWDLRHHRLFCARDHLGVKPFYYVRSEASFAFASEIKPLLALSWVPRRLNEVRIADYLLQVAEDKTATFYEGILRLPPAHTLSITPAGMCVRLYWSPDPNHELHYPSDAAYAAIYRELFVEAVRCRLRSPSTVGSFLSGGLDSSAVTCVARELLEAEEIRPLRTFSLVFDEVRQSDERPYIEAVVAQGGLEPHYIYGDRANPFDPLDRMLRAVEEPFFTPTLYLCWQLYRAAQARGVRVVLDGFLGDTVVSHGDRYLTELAVTGQWRTLMREMYTVAGLIGGRRKGYPRLLHQYVLEPLLLEPLRRTCATVLERPVPGLHRGQFINADFARYIGCMAREREVPQTPLSTRLAHSVELMSGAYSGVFEIVDKATAAFGIRLRFPFTDRRLIEYCLAIPVTQKYRDGWTRVIARRALHDYLPDTIRQRYGKKYWHQAFYHALLGGSARDALDDVVFGRLPIAGAYIDFKRLQKAYSRIREKHESGERSQRPDVLFSCWAAVVLTRWLEHEAEARAELRSKANGGLTEPSNGSECIPITPMV